MPIKKIESRNPIDKKLFHNLLKDWIENSNEDIIGDPNGRGQLAWIWINDGTQKYFLNADTKRLAVREYLDLVEETGDFVEWKIVPNNRGKLNKVAFGSSQKTIKGFYFYLLV